MSFVVLAAGEGTGDDSGHDTADDHTTVDGTPDGAVAVLTPVEDDGTVRPARRVVVADLPATVARLDADRPRWVWDDTRAWYPSLLAAGVAVERCHDLRLCRAILSRSPLAPLDGTRTPDDDRWDGDVWEDPARSTSAQQDLFDGLGRVRERPDPLTELQRQLRTVASSDDPARLRLLLAAESTGALVAAELQHHGLPLDTATHDELLTGLVGPRPPHGGRPRRLDDLTQQVRDALGDPALNPDSQPDLLRALRRAGLDVTTTRAHELRRHSHPAVTPLLEYKRLARLLSANGWAWVEQWVRDGRYRAEYVPGGTPTGRWATNGGGALQLPVALRGAVRADPGWRLVAADARQLEPRVLAAMAGDEAMAAAARAQDLYQGIVNVGILPTRTEAKTAMLGAIYGATTGPSATLLPRLTSAFPRAMRLVEDAARAGERGDPVRTWLGRGSPRPHDRWHDVMAAAAAEGASPEAVALARRTARDWGRFTRNFVVQGTAAEWALCWVAGVRRRLRTLEGGAQLVYFLHDEVLVHTPADLADEVTAAITDAATQAGRLLFGSTPVDFPLDVSVVSSYDQAG